MKKTSLWLVVGAWLFLATSCLWAEEITILFTGGTHAMIYPCNCPQEPDGGVARRATLVKQLKKSNPHTLVLDSGGFVAGGLLDEYTQNTELDKQRTLANLKAMEIMGYDAAAVSSDEFNFGRAWLEENLAQAKVNILSCNIKLAKAKPFILKEIAGTKVGIIGVTSLAAMPRAEGVQFLEPKASVIKAVEAARQQGAEIIILLSNLEPAEMQTLSETVPGIDIVIEAHAQEKDKLADKIGPMLFLRSSWQGRKLVKLSLTFKEHKIGDYKAEALRLSDGISDDPEVRPILPHCFSDTQCKKEGMIGSCQEPGNIKSRCLFTQANKIPLTIITPKLCKTCDSATTVNMFKKIFPGLAATYINYPSAQANKLIKDFALTSLPAYIFSRDIAKDKRFDDFKNNLKSQGNFYLLKPVASGISYFINRKMIKARFDVFISLYDQGTPALLEVLKEFRPTIHFLAVKEKDWFEASKGNLEVEEYLRCVCVQKYSPQDFWDYISCRSKHTDSSWWEDCLAIAQREEIRTCAQGGEGKNLLEDNIALNKELAVMLGPAYLIDNQEVFASRGIPTKEELKKILAR